jgi:hypothetical protein
MTRDLVRRAVHGFAFGAGFAVAALAVWFVMQQFSGIAGEVGDLVAGGTSPARPALAVPQVSPGQVSQVRASNHRVERRNGDAIVLGLLHNDGDATVRSVRVEAAYYDDAGRLVDLCGWYVAPSLAAGEDKPFKVACGGTPDRPVPASASVRLRIVEAW